MLYPTAPSLPASAGISELGCGRGTAEGLVPFLLPVCRGTGNYPRDKGCWRQPRQSAGPWDSSVTSDLKSKTEAVRCAPRCVASAPCSSSCQKGGDDLRSQGFPAITGLFVKPPANFVHLPRATGIRTLFLACGCVLQPSWGREASNRIFF